MKKELQLSILFILLLLFLTPGIAFAEVINSGVAFRETGLPSGTSWSVICNGTQYKSNSTDIAITLQPGTYNFSVPDIPGYSATPKSGNVTAYLDPIKLTTIAFSPTIPELSTPAIFTGLFLVSLFGTAWVLTKRTRRNQSMAVKSN